MADFTVRRKAYQRYSTREDNGFCRLGDVKDLFADTVTVSGAVALADTITVDTISEYTSGSGVTLDSVQLKDGGIVCADAATLEVDTINEATAAAGVTADGVLMKDGKVTHAVAGALNGCPLATNPANAVVFFEDFITTASCKTGTDVAGGPFSVAADGGAWLVTEVDNATGQTETVLGTPSDGSTGASAQGGWGQFTCCNNTADLISAQLNGESFKLATGKKLWFECKFAVEDISETEVFIGLADAGTDLYAAGAGDNDHVGFMLDGDGDLDFSIFEGGTNQSKSDTAVNFVDGSIATLETTDVVHTCAFYWNGAGVITVYVDGTLTNTLTDNGAAIAIPDGMCLSPGFQVETQGNTAETIWIDYIYIVQER